MTTPFGNNLSLTRRSLLGAGAGLGLVASMGAPAHAAYTTYKYGSNASQFGELSLPTGTPRGVVVVIHGGYWRSQYTLSLGRPLAADLVTRGWAVWNLEYRRVGNGGGNPTTFDDVSNGIDYLSTRGLNLSKVITMGHSAGGHLGTWAASRKRFSRWSAAKVNVTHVISQAGVLDLTTAYNQNLGSGAVRSFMGTAPGSSYDPCDPQRHIPLTQPLWAIHSTQDTTVPISQSQNYVNAATAAGAQAQLVTTTGDHFSVITTTHPAWQQQIAILDSIG